ncbi:TetR/AcrR family transcriptional regulator C-terminal domain-containing protein [Nocardia puris]|uniref:TetR family transcriptional regulator n=1 Tax=Nocardia puris TaxID=208602 RepID=A0A366DV93_9NOCA|nr:TetR/AcrR family transcriptional regulator [Nocardia puris]MBF6210594.1 TetR/AcrR family transcriptional regulator C-terminal domain-containing protein [Nocardia puris]MBF6369320.1 TetR/AcrR family transcriptional regulator C-terminal domain-containing protein [Nocardia puris]MBF6457855.1 TetR/AcrR family transcriptional regulator C-terminal domain-containing protein [Nocardia puris]RBO94021.1 TetR family transcriptional regulator [Nocardia puris]
MTTTEASGSGDLARTLDLLWDTAPRPTRGPKPGLTLDGIIAAAVKVADEEGLAAVTMRRVATELGTGTMSLYRYVPGKAELLDLMLDRAQAPAGPLPEDGGWRAALEALAYEQLEMFRAHPWLLQVDQSRPVIGPGAAMGMELVLARIKAMGLPDVELVSVVVTISGYVTGLARNQLYEREAERSSRMTEDEFWNTQGPYLTNAISSGRFPTLASLSEDAFGSEFDHFAFGLHRLLDGLEAYVRQRNTKD